jgi:hypothetical protein
MRYLIAALIAVSTFGADFAFSVKDAEAVVCARGVYRAGCAAVAPRARGAVVVRRPPVRRVIVR